MVQVIPEANLNSISTPIEAKTVGALIDLVPGIAILKQSFDSQGQLDLLI
jgi:hypothetical protein